MKGNGALIYAGLFVFVSRLVDGRTAFPEPFYAAAVGRSLGPRWVMLSRTAATTRRSRGSETGDRRGGGGGGGGSTGSQESPGQRRLFVWKSVGLGIS